MARILSLTSGPDDWKGFLADPEKHWRRGYSARTLAHCWETADGFPPEIALTFDQCSEPLLKDLMPVVAVPEFRVPLPGGARASQNDIFVLARSSSGPVCIMVEGKVRESFGPRLQEWQETASPGKSRRLAFLLSTIGLKGAPGEIRYQLLHRAASTVITGHQYHAAASVMLVHSFSEDRACWDDYELFRRLFGQCATPGRLQRLQGASAIPLFAAWVEGDRRFLES